MGLLVNAVADAAEQEGSAFFKAVQPFCLCDLFLQILQDDFQGFGITGFFEGPADLPVERKSRELKKLSAFFKSIKGRLCLQGRTYISGRLFLWKALLKELLIP